MFRLASTDAGHCEMDEEQAGIPVVSEEEEGGDGQHAIEDELLSLSVHAPVAEDGEEAAVLAAERSDARRQASEEVGEAVASELALD